MKLSELAVMASRYAERHHEEDLNVVIETKNGGIPCYGMVDVKSVNPGCDWTKGYFILHPAIPVVTSKMLQVSVEESARTRLEELKSAYTALGFKYVAKAREEEWIEGFVQGVRMFSASVRGEEEE
jgi:phosphatidate phosphatase APP1